MNPGRNDPCPCGSGKKYKKCCGKFESSPPTLPGQQKANAASMRASANTPPTAQIELNQLVALFNAGHHAEVERHACSLLGRHPDSGFAWKVLSASLLMQGKDALAALQNATKFLPNDAAVHYNLGNNLRNLGRLDEAEASYRRALQIGPDDAAAHGNLGNIMLEQGRFKEAEASYRRALQISPDAAAAHGNLGNVMLEQGRFKEAEASYRRALQIEPGNVEAHSSLGNILYDLGRLDEAEASCRRALLIRPDDAEALYNLASILQELGRLDEAEASCRRALQVRPDFAEAYCNLGSLLLESGRLDEAQASCRRALLIKQDYAEAHYNLSSILQELDRLDEAEASCRQALQIKPDFAEAYCNLGSFLLELGRLDEAESCLRRALEIKPDLIEARFSFAQLRKVKADDENLAALIAAEEAAQNGTTPLQGKDAMFLHFALGKSYGDIGNHEKAFPHFIDGCKLKRATYDYDPDETAQRFVSIKRNFDAATIDRLRGGNPSRLPIFVLGMPRSGTTLTEQIIASHPEVHGAGELPDLMEIAYREIAGAAFPDNMRLLDPERLAAWGAEYVTGLQRHAPDARRITDKMPANFMAVGLIHLMLPNAKIIHVNRNPVDTCLSCFSKLFTFGQEHTYDLFELGRYYADYARLMAHWRKVLPAGAFLDVQYEDIVADQETQARRLIEYCGLEWNDACLDFHKNKRAVRTASVAQVRQPIYKSSVERWRPYEKFLGPLFDALGDFAPERS
jgi:tetratricopeptide (TPR) repeat protein